jgi:hypothetical protein
MAVMDQEEVVQVDLEWVDLAEADQNTTDMDPEELAIPYV